MREGTQGENTRVILSRATVKDAMKIVLAMDPGATQNLSFFSEPPTLPRERAYLARMEESGTDYLFLIEHVGAGDLLGTIGLHEVDAYNRTARLGILIFRAESRGKGYGSEALLRVLRFAFEELKLNKVYLNVFAENERGRKLYSALGFKEEGCLREEYLLSGSFHDLVRMSILKREWQEGGKA